MGTKRKRNVPWETAFSLCDQQVPKPSQAHPVVPRRLVRSLVASFAQERMWFLQLWAGDISAYNYTVAMKLGGKLNFNALKAALDGIVCRHEVLRTIWCNANGVPRPETLDPMPVPIRWLDLSGLPPEIRWGQALKLATEIAQNHIDLSQGPIFRAAIFQLGPEEHFLLLSTNLIAFDVLSAKILFDELLSLYESFSKGVPSELDKLPIQYSDFAQWQREQMQGVVLDELLSYWTKQLSKPLPILLLPVDRSRPAAQTYSGASFDFVLPDTVSSSLMELSGNDDRNLFTILLAAFSVLAHRYVGQDDLIIGTPVPGRNAADTHRLIGPFDNMLPLRIDLSGDPSFVALLRHVQEIYLDALTYQDLPFEKIVEHARPEKSLLHADLFHVMLSFKTPPEISVNKMSLAVEQIKLPPMFTDFDLTLEFARREEIIAGSMVYNTDLFEGGTIERMVGHLKTLLEGIVANADQRISELPILTEAERRQLLVEWNMTEAEYPRDACIHELFEKQVEKTPEAVAVVFEGKELTYRELNIRANQLAHYLRKQGVGPEVLVGICMERSLEMVVGLLGILKAGGAYVPLDPEYPKDRLVFILKDANPALCLTQASLREKLEENETKFVQLNQDWLAAQLNVSDERTVLAETTGLTSDSLAYVIFTSGSTGSPKGVQVTHRSLVNFIVSIGQILGLMPEDSILALTTIAFDISGLELLLPLSLGAKIILFDGAKSVDGAQLIDQIIKYNPTVIQATPARWRLLLDAGWKGRKGLKVLCGGEAFSKQLLVDLLELTDRVWNLYGPTETTIWSTCKLLFNTRDPISIGKPIGNTRAYVLDRKRNPVPIGMPGELYIAGDGLARGYLNRPELTAEKFIRDPFSSELGARLYRTGDLVRYRADGNIEFLGRMDDQVKLRGFRIELGEIEATLGQCEGVGQAAVVLREESGDKRLVAYVVRKREGIETGDLRRFLQEKLPEYMIPSVFVFLNELPLSVSGKVNRHVLPVPEQVRPELAVRYVGPRTPVEEELARIWAELLKIERVGIHDNFFELGGHSLLATHVISQVRRLFNVSLPLRRLFEMPTISEMAKSLTVLCDRPEHEDELAKIFAELENMSDEEAKRALADADKG
jgi:amino acid adenylation domain-containing protein